MSTDKEKIEMGADEYELKTDHDCKPYDGCCYSYSDIENAFKAGVAWRDANPSEDVLALVEAIKEYEKAFKIIEAQVQIRPDYFRETWNRQMIFLASARTALARWDARGK